MSNRSIATRIMEVVAAYEAKQVGASAIARALELHEPAFEALPRTVRDEMHHLSVQIIRDDVTPLEEAQLGFKSDGVAISRLRALLQSVEE